MSPRSKEQFETMRKQSRTQILNSALDLFIQKGYKETSIQMIAAKARISKGLIYNYFDSKEAVLKAVLVKSVFDIEVNFQALKAIKDPRERLTVHIQESVNNMKTNPGFWKLHHQLLVNPSTNPIIKMELNKFLLSVHQFSEEIFQQIGFNNPQNEVLIFEATFNGMMNLYILSDSLYPVDATKNYLIEKYCLFKKITEGVDHE